MNKNNKAKEFFDLVSKMRETQKLYFKTRASGVLAEARDLERKVDAEIKRANMIMDRRKGVNRTLFD